MTVLKNYVLDLIAREFATYFARLSLIEAGKLVKGEGETISGVGLKLLRRYGAYFPIVKGYVTIMNEEDINSLFNLVSMKLPERHRELVNGNSSLIKAELSKFHYLIRSASMPR